MPRRSVAGLVLAFALVATAPATRAQDAAEEEYKRLAARAVISEKPDTVRTDIQAFQRRYPGTTAAVKAAGLLHDLASPLDKLDAKAIPELERFTWHPKETVAVVGEHRGRQAGSVTSVLFGPHAKWLASGSTNGLIRIWDSGTMRLKHTLGHGQGAYCLAVSKDGSSLAVGGGDGQVHFWDMTADPPKDKGLHKVSSTPLLGLSLSPGNKFFACGGSDARVYLWDLTADPPKEHNTASGHNDVIHAVVYSPSGKLIASAAGEKDKTIRLWTLTDQNRLKDRGVAETPSGVLCLAFHPTEDKTLVSGGSDGVIRVWDTTNKLTQKTALTVKNGAVNAITFSASGKTLAAAFSDGTVRTWAFGTKLTEKAVLEGHKASATAVAYSPDGTSLATGSTDWTVRLWPGVSGIKPRDKTVSKGHLSHVYTVAFNPTGAGLASGGYDNTVRLWDLAAAEPKEHASKLKDEGAIYTLAFAPDGKTLASGGASAMFRTCDAEGRFLFGFKGHAGQVSRLDWSPDGKLVASCSTDKSVRLWEGLTGQGVSAITDFATYVNNVAFAPGGKQLACASGYYLYDKSGQIVVKDGDVIYNDSTVRIYDVADLKEKARWKYEKVLMSGLAYTPDGRDLLAGGSDQKLRDWDALKLPKEPEIFYKWASGGISVLACSPDGRWLATYGPDYRVQLIELATRKKVKEWVMGEQFGNLAFAPDSRHLAIGVATGVVLVLRLEGPKPSG
jgi:WD40 repeat protein